MNRVKRELEILKSLGIESIPVSKVLCMIEEAEDSSRISPMGQDTETPSATVATTPVGGTIFYIDDTADGEYQFFDADGTIIDNINVGDKPYAYRVIKKGSKDKYYVYHDEIYSNLRWTYCKDKGYVYESLGTSNNIGLGKTNTEIAMSKDNGAYVTINSNGYPTIWYQLQQVRNAKVGGCDDWFVPSLYEIELLISAITYKGVSGGMIAGSSCAESVFANKWVWSSSDYSDQHAWFWSYDYQHWDSSYKDNHFSVIFTRAF